MSFGFGIVDPIILFVRMCLNITAKQTIQSKPPTTPRFPQKIPAGMASNLHNSHCLCRSSTTATPTPTVCYCCSLYPVSYHPPPPDPHSIPPCFHNPQQQPHLFNPCPNSPYNSQTLHHHLQTTQCCPSQPFHQTGQRYVQELHHHCQKRQVDHQPVVSSLLRRIASLESSLRRRSTSSQSICDAAARTIQTHFRAFLVRRSRTLSQLKELASIKSALNILKSSASDSDPQAVSHKAKHLLLKLDAIQGGDPMIRDGKKSISRELIQFIGLIDGGSVQSCGFSSRIVKNVKHGSANNKSRVQVLQDIEKMESIIDKYLELRKSVEDDEEFESPRVSVIKKAGVLQTRKGGLTKRHGGVQSKANKFVTFAEDGNVFRFSQRELKPISNGEANSIDGQVSIDANEVLMENLCGRVDDLGVSLKEVEVDEEAQSEDVGGSQGSSDAETEPNYSSIKEGNFEKRLDCSENGSFVFSAPLPVKMEGRADFVNKSKTVRFAD